jgi:hypothetical protein
MVFDFPIANYQVQDYTHAPQVDQAVCANVVLENPELKISVKLAFDQTTLPYLAEWKMMREGSYVLAMQPMNCYVWGGKAEVRRQNALPFRNAGESCKYTIELEVLEY